MTHSVDSYSPSRKGFTFRQEETALKKMTREEVADSILRNHNHSWYEDIYMRNKDRKDHPALLYRGTEITYGEFFYYVERYAKSLREYGISHGDEFVACLQQTPDYPILVAAASLILNFLDI